MTALFTEPKLLNTQRWRNRRVGILGGSFNPPHEGHIHIARIALNAMKLDAIWWLVTPLNPFKAGDGALPFEERVKRSKIITRDDPKIIVTTLEQDLDTHYSYASIKIIKKNFPHTQFAWIGGTDNIEYFHHWQHWQDLLSEICMIHIARSGPLSLVKQFPFRMISTQNHIFVDHGYAYPLNSHTSYWLLNRKTLDISSTQIREKTILQAV